MRNSTHLAAALALLALAAQGCTRDTGGLEPVPLSTNPIVFADDFTDGLDYLAFDNSNYAVLSIDPANRYKGSASLRITVPDPGNSYAGGVLATSIPRDLSGYNALTFWAKSSINSTLNVAGLGNDNTGNSKYTAEWQGIPLTTAWEKYVIPIPRGDRLVVEAGLFFFAEDAEGASGHDVWFDEIKFETIGTISDPRPAMNTEVIGAFIGATTSVHNTRTTFNVGGTDQTIDHMPGYFTFKCTDESVATANGGVIRAVGTGTATITARLDTVDVTGSVTVNVSSAPTTAAPDPSLPEADVISLFSDNYASFPVTTWSADWDVADVMDFQIAGNDIKAYTNLLYAGIEFAQNIDARNYTHFHIDVWVPAGTTYFAVKLVDFGADGIYQGAPDSEHEIPFTAATDPPLTTETWISLEIPLANFMGGPMGLASREHLAQLIISGTGNTAFVDNIYFHK